MQRLWAPRAKYQHRSLSRGGETRPFCCAGARLNALKPGNAKSPEKLCFQGECSGTPHHRAGQRLQHAGGGGRDRCGPGWRSPAGISWPRGPRAPPSPPRPAFLLLVRNLCSRPGCCAGVGHPPILRMTVIWVICCQRRAENGRNPPKMRLPCRGNIAAISGRPKGYVTDI